MFRVTVENEVVFEGKMKKIGGGGTKSAFELIGTDNVVLLPNATDGPSLVSIFDRICNEEVFMNNKLNSIDILGLNVTNCTVQKIDDESSPLMQGLYARSFSSFTKDLAHVVDRKELLKCTWTYKEPVSDWVSVFEPLIKDLIKVVDAGIYPWGDSYNLLIAEKGSPYYTGSGQYAVRYFGFDFSSKRYILSSFEDLSNIKTKFVKSALSEAVDDICKYIAELPDNFDEIKNHLFTLIK